MRLPSSLAAVLFVGSVVGAQQGADVYLLQSNTQSFPDSAPRIPRELARHILLQRAARDRYGITLHDIPDARNDETVISHLNAFSKAPSPLFAEPEPSQPSQLVIILQGIDSGSGKELKKALAGYKPAFVVADPPSYEANDRLILDFNAIGVPQQPGACTIESAVNPFEHVCWETSSSIARFDLTKEPNLVQDVVKSIPLLTKFVQNGDLEAALVLLPESSRLSSPHSWTTSAQPLSDLRRRVADSEAILADDAGPAGGAPHAFAAPTRKTIPSCFQSYNSCVAATGNCTGHGLCLDKYENDTTSRAVCFSCACLATVDHRPGKDGVGAGRSTTHWGGNMCQKIDVSTPFWLIAGFTVVIVGAVSFAIGLLFSVGEEKLPGVIGAGVSRSK